ncbi:hypothetical protein [Niabella ginsengisoli]|uniref:Uncharacterized protein n=1 Tax=Niabella ginsengisoli TaxID=522298 RepID=A0ABS9SP51_9BACT|nr:hypothetical protein [Niabella ginsengisoli]MCH5600051.1 hypothetical protein [Niabella ginsengisoli]
MNHVPQSADPVVQRGKPRSVFHLPRRITWLTRFSSPLMGLYNVVNVVKDVVNHVKYPNNAVKDVVSPDFKVNGLFISGLAMHTTICDVEYLQASYFRYFQSYLKVASDFQKKIFRMWYYFGVGDYCIRSACGLVTFVP